MVDQMAAHFQSLGEFPSPGIESVTSQQYVRDEVKILSPDDGILSPAVVSANTLRLVPKGLHSG